MGKLVSPFVKRACSFGCPGWSLRDLQCFAHPVSTPDELRQQLDAVTQVRVARIERDRANQKLRAAIVRAMDAGAKPKDIAAAADISRQRVHQIYREG